MAVFAGWLGASRALALEKIEEGGPERAEFARAVRQLFLDEEYELLDLMADKLWREKTRFADGSWKLASFYKAFRVESGDSKVNWHEWWARYGRWEKQYPQSATARVMHAWTMMNYAWEARGGGWANTVSGGGWELFTERLKIGRDMLESDPALKKIPGYYEVMMTVALGQGWPREKAEDLFMEAVVLARDYQEFYFHRAYLLQPKWQGKEGEWLKFADDAAEATKDDWGSAFYARVVWGTLGLPTAKRFQDEKIDWPKLKQSFEDFVQRTPDSLWNKNAFCYYACMAEDRETAGRLFEELQDRYALSIWQGEDRFLWYKNWAVRKPINKKK